MRIFIIIFVVGYFFIAPLQVLAALCDPVTITRPLYNQALESFLQEQNTKFFAKINDIRAQTKDCSRADQFKNAWQDLQKSSSFGIEQFIFSFSSFYNSSCRQKDTEKLVRQIDWFEQGILSTIQECKDPSQLITISQASNKMLRLVRDHDGKPEDRNKYWDDALYKSDSDVCPTSSWKDVERAWCELKNNAVQFSLSSKNAKLDPAIEKKQQALAKQERLKIAQTEALKYIQQNLPSFLQLQSSEGANIQVGKFNGMLGIIFAPIINSINNFLNISDTLSLQETQTIPGTKTQDSIKLLTTQKLLRDIHDSYGKSYDTQLNLEKEIHAIRKSVENMTGKQQTTRSFYSFLSQLKNTEKSTPRSCFIDINNP